MHKRRWSHNINASKVLAMTFGLPKKDQLNYLKQFMIDLFNDDVEAATNPEAKEILMEYARRKRK